jgi:NADH-quinone oxidoreductase subunit G
MPTLTIDGQTLDVPPGSTVLQACELAGKEIPRFCYHDRLSIAGNCRMCLVEMEKAPKPIASCAMPVAEGMVIHTDSPTVQKARNGVMEFLLINHPLDCPICDQGGECDLQDQAMAYGRDSSRFEENKRAVKEKYMGPLIKTVMTRCIHCTRCVRFAEEVAGVEAIGAVQRGENMEITTLEQAVASELSANVIDLCPVGALTSKPYAFHARPWELRKTESIDVFDALGSNIRIDVRGNEVLRILPRLHEDVNEEWLSDKARYACDGLKRQRLDRPYIRKNGQLQPSTWEEALWAAAEAIRKTSPSELGVVAGDHVEVESLFLMKELFHRIGSTNTECRQDGALLDAAVPTSYRFNSKITGIDVADVLLLVGTNPRWEAPLLNARLRKRWLTGKLKIFLIGEAFDLTYRYTHLGIAPELFQTVAQDTQHVAHVALRQAEFPMLILGNAVLTHPDAAALLASAGDLADSVRLMRENWNGYNILPVAASRVGGMQIGFVPKDSKPLAFNALKTVYLLGADAVTEENLHGKFVIYQGHHGDKGAQKADVILPGAAYTEKNGLYVNLEGRPQYARQAAMPPGEAKEDWKIIRALSDALQQPLPFETFAQVRAQLFSAFPDLEKEDTVPTASVFAPKRHHARATSTPFVYPIQNYYLTDPISRSSQTMAECSKVFHHAHSN